MSDVSGIPNLGFGGGNFFAPSVLLQPADVGGAGQRGLHARRITPRTFKQHHS